MPFLAWPLIWCNGVLAKTRTNITNSIKSLFFCLYSRVTTFPRVHFKRFFPFQFSQFQILQTAFLCFLVFSTTVHGQDVTSSDTEDPYIDPDGASAVLQPTKRVESQRAYMFGINYGLNSIIILAPALSFSMYWNPIVIGIEISDSDNLGIWVVISQWFVIYLMVVPSLQDFGHYHVDMGLHELFITLGFVGIFFLSYFTFLGKVPILPISDKHLCRSWQGH